MRSLLILLAVAVTPGLVNDSAGLRGYSDASARVEREWEAKFKATPEPQRMRNAMQRLAARPHHVGSAHGKANAEWLVEQFKSYGWDAQIERFDVLFPTPKERVLELVAPTTFRARLEEPALAIDPTSNQRAEQLPTYNAYSGEGDVTAPLVYVNYGVPADYEELERRGVSVKGAIVIARYGQSWRGIKPKVAAEHGAVGAIIYSDPRDDGYQQGEVYPQGAWRNSTGVQRGSVMDMPVRPGDPLTPGVGATPDAKRLAVKDAEVIMKIPVLPISYGDAQPLLAALRGPVAPESWRGGLPITYRIGPGPARVHLRMTFNWDQKPLYNVIAKLRGSTFPDEWIVRGNHHDGWVNGAEDPISGLVPELEEARAMGELVKQGWRPKRTIVYAAWDGEEPALLGSTEWVEAHRDELTRYAVAYINTDGNGRGFFNAGGSHSLEKFVNDVIRDVDDPETQLTVWKRAQLAAIRFGSSDDRKDARTREDLRIDALGSGSDFTPFLQHAGVATLNMGFGGEDGGGIYHSIYDSFRWYTTFSDTSFVYGRALAQSVGTMVMRLAGAELLPFAFTNVAETSKGYLNELQKLRDTRAEQIAERSRQLDEGVFAATNDPRNPTVPPKRDATPPFLNFAALQNSIDGLQRAADDYESAVRKAHENGGASLAKASLAGVNAKLIQAERALTTQSGLPTRPWYKHLLYAPGLYTGYGVKTMPAAREAMEQGRWDEANVELGRIAAAIDAEAALVRSATEALTTAMK
ncbi:MAG TPA: transferrin receptor-like dimerization domain-containing protein [Gemmatimonadaceae bacterium]|nr:transferrin receptor-like dimerization domain-containing protein [Gemmatimonadaceae bacterium]